MVDGFWLGLLGPTISFFLSLVFFVFWYHQDAEKHVFGLGVAYALCSIGVIFVLFVLPGMSYSNVITACVLYTSGITLLAWSTCRRVKLAAPIKLMTLTGFTALIVGCVVTYSFEDVTYRVNAINGMITINFILAAHALIPAFKTDFNSRLIALVFLVNASIALVTPLAIFYVEGPVFSDEYRQSLHWGVRTFAFALMAMVTGLCLLFALATDVFNQIKVASNTDFLTGLKTRRAFEEERENMFAMMERSSLPLSIIVADIDHFKKVNDTYGHQIGDQVITAFGQLMSKSSRKSDLVGRVGGEEFCAVLWNTNEVGARLVAENLRTQFEQMSIAGVPADANLTASFGVATCLPNETSEELYKRADKALYAAKDSGRNKVNVDRRADPVQRVMRKAATA